MAQRVVHCHDLPPQVLELVALVVHECSYDFETTAVELRSLFPPDSGAADLLTPDVLQRIVAEMEEDGTLQFFLAEAIRDAPFQPPPRARGGAFASDTSFNASTGSSFMNGSGPSMTVETTWVPPLLAVPDHALVRIAEFASFSGMSVAKPLRDATYSASRLWAEINFVERGTQGEPKAEISARLRKRIALYTTAHGHHAKRMSVRNTLSMQSSPASGVPLLLEADLAGSNVFNFSVTSNLQKLSLHSFREVELLALLGNFDQLRCVEQLQLLECPGCGSDAMLAQIEKLQSLTSLAIWGFQCTQVSLAPEQQAWPAGLRQKLKELVIDPIVLDAHALPGLNSPDAVVERVHIRAKQPRLAVTWLPLASLRFLSLAGPDSEDVSNPFVAAFLLRDQELSSSLLACPHLESLILAGHPALSPLCFHCFQATGAALHLVQLAFIRCRGLDSEEAAQAFLSVDWPCLQTLEPPRPLFEEHILREWGPPSTYERLNLLCSSAMTLEPEEGQPLVSYPHEVRMVGHWWNPSGIQRVRRKT